MIRSYVSLVIGPLAAALSTPAAAVCSQVSVAQGYHEADVVVRARTVAVTRVDDDEPSPAFRSQWGEYPSVVLNRLRVLEVFKGRPGPTIKFFEEIDSGRFDVDLGREYLLYFHYYRPYRGSGSVIRGAMYVRHVCGPTKPWAEVGAVELAYLRRKAKAR